MNSEVRIWRLRNARWGRDERRKEEDQVQLGDTGVVTSFTLQSREYAPMEMKDFAPYFEVMIRLDKSKKEVVWRLTDMEINYDGWGRLIIDDRWGYYKIATGMEVEAVPRVLAHPSKSGPIPYGIAFRPRLVFGKELEERKMDDKAMLRAADEGMDGFFD